MSKKTKYISLLQLKGGVGKSSIAINLTGFLIENLKSVLLVDADLPQATAFAWSSQFNHALLTIETAQNLPELMDVLRNADGQYDYVVIDSPPRMADMLKATLMTSDLAIVPMSPTAPDIWSFDDLNDVIQDAFSSGSSTEVRILWNKFKPLARYQKIRADVVKDFDQAEFKTTLSDLVAYPDVVNSGKHIMIHSHTRAKAQFKAFGQEVLQLLEE